MAALTGANSKRRSHNAVVARVGDSFDFMEHELGMPWGSTHSFGTTLFPWKARSRAATAISSAS